MSTLSPMMEQYFKIKEQHKEHILFFRLGDFYEMFFDDAKLASRELELTLTGRDCGQEERAPMCGIPYHSASNYIAKLIKKGYKVAICEQTEDPALAKGIVKREVIRVITPGTIVEDNMLNEGENNYIASIYLINGAYGISFADTSTGEVHITQTQDDSNETIQNELSMFMPKEVIFNEEFLSKKEVAKFLREKIHCAGNLVSSEDYTFENSNCIIQKHFNKTLGELEIENKEIAVCSFGALLKYLYNTQQKGLECLNMVQYYNSKRYMNLDLTARRNLELIETLRDKSKKGSLLSVIDKTKTAMGKRLIRSYLEKPLVNALEINKRLNAVEEFTENAITLQNTIEALNNIFDLERILSRVLYGNISPRDLKSLEYTVDYIPILKNHIKPMKSVYLREVYSSLDELLDIKELINKSISDEPPLKFKDGGVIKKGYNIELDELRDIVDNTKQYISNIEVKEREKTGIKNLKIGYNRVFGYYLEVTKLNIGQVPDEYIRKQTLTNSERYITEELKILEGKILSANANISTLELSLYNNIIENISKEIFRIQKTAQSIAKLDVYCSFAKVSLVNKYTKPNVDMSGIIDIKDGRHPVVENMLGDSLFVANDVYLDKNENQVAIITGPNMAGKSTYMRQTSIICIMAQIGCFVPAKSATIGVVDGIYTRVGATDDLSSGQSTFMVEMSEVSNILKNATSDSLLILDEIGRGTSTFDGMSIAQAVVEYIANKKKLGAKTLFATHYHELTQIENNISSVKNYNIAVKKRGEDIIFLRRIIRGGTDDSYGIYVSKLAGIPNVVVKRAKDILEKLENGNQIYRNKSIKIDNQIMLTQPASSKIEKRISELNLDEISPKQALAILYEIKDMI